MPFAESRIPTPPRRRRKQSIPYFPSKPNKRKKKKKVQKMPRNGDAEEENAPILPSTTRISNRADPILITCRCFSFVTILAAILCIGANILAAVRSFKHGYDVFDGIFRCYAVLIAFFVILAETEWSFFTKFSKVLEYWAGRGMLQIFVAVMTRAFPDYFGERRELVLFQSIASYLLLACGGVYVVSGILCIGFLKRARQKQEISREQAAKDLKELERRKEELEQLLLAERV